MPTADNLNEMSWQERRRLDQQHFIAQRAASHAQINQISSVDACDNVPTMPRATFAQPRTDEASAPMTSAEAGALWSPR